MNRKMPLELRLEIASVERDISHMEADLTYHRAQIQLFGEEIMDRQKKLQKLHRFSNRNLQHHSLCDENKSSDLDDDI